MTKSRLAPLASLVNDVEDTCREALERLQVVEERSVCLCHLSWIYINCIPSNILTMSLVQIQRQGRGGWGKGVCEGGRLRSSPWQVPPCSRWEGPGRVAARWPSTTTATSSTESTSRQGRGEAGTWKWWRSLPTEMSTRGLPPVKALPLWRKANWSIFQLKTTNHIVVIIIITMWGQYGAHDDDDDLTFCRILLTNEATRTKVLVAHTAH